MRKLLCVLLVAVVASSAAACSTSSSGADASTDAPDGSNPDGSSAVDAATDAKDGGPFCCPPDPKPTSCMQLGGVATGSGKCGRTCDFFCSTNWRIEDDSSGCPVWKWGTRAPLPDEDGLCFKELDAGTD